MRKVVIAIAVTLGWVIVSIAQPCLPDGITFTTQSQIDSYFLENSNNCKKEYRLAKQEINTSPSYNPT